MTRQGEKGVNISGGQKQRISLARAEYSNRDIYLFDDPLSAVDAHVGHHLFYKSIRGALKHKTRVLVTHQLQYLRDVDYIYVIEQGQVQQHGTYKDLCDEGLDFAKLLQDQKNMPKLERQSSGEHKQTSEGDGNMENGISEESKMDMDKGKTIDEEERYTGAVKPTVYISYLRATGSVLFLFFLFFVSVSLEGSHAAENLWLSRWSDNTSDESTGYYLKIYLCITLGGTVMAFLRQFSWAKGALDGAARMHNKLLSAILRAPMGFFYATPSGRIINRFSKDQNSIDQAIPELFSDWFLCMFACVGSMIFITILLPWFLIFLIPLVIVYYFVQQYYRQGCRELGRLQSISSSPIFAQFSETLEGLDSIRAFHLQSQLAAENIKLLDVNSRSTFILQHAARWLSIRIELIGSGVVLAVSVLILFFHGELSAGVAGLMLSLSQSVTADLSWWVRQWTSLESQMNNVERILHYTATPSEAALINDKNRPPKSWPEKGMIEFKNVNMRYRADLDLVLQEVNFRILSQEKIGIVGRTGAGKSSLTNALFRLIEVVNGSSILIDGLDISTIGLRDLRSQLAIIPQDPFLFSGTIRSNLDPFNEFQDNAIWIALERVHIATFIRSLHNELYAEVKEKGSNLSVGQRQLLCMGRALLRETKILIVDEATASVDTETDSLIQKTIREEFKLRTVLTIAHRLDTILDSDRILVLDKGRVVEFDSPRVLLEKEGGVFRHLVQQSGKQIT